MKKMLTCVLVCTLLAAAAAFGYKTSGFGKVVSATTTAAQHYGFVADTLSVYNGGSVGVWAQVNTTTNSFTNDVAQGVAVPIPAGVSFVFDTRGKDIIENVFYQAFSGTQTVYIAGF